MDLRTSIAARIAHQLVGLRGTGRSLTVDVGEVFYQAAAYDADQVLIEVSAEQYLPADRRLTPGAHDELLRLGFNRPTPSMPNWWIGIEDGREKDLFTAARATVTALLDIYHVGVEALADAVGLSRPTEPPGAQPEPQPLPTTGEGDPLAIDGSLGEVLLFPNGVATLDGAVWSEQPVREWLVNGEGVLAITFAPAGDRRVPHVGFAEHTEQNAALLRRFTPSLPERRALNRLLALAEQYALACITAGTVYHRDLAATVWEARAAHRELRPETAAGWPPAARLAAALDAADCFYRTQSADNNHQLRGDEQDTWEAIQKWVRISPWRDDFDFEIMPAEPIPVHIAPGPEVEIQRIR